MVKQKGLPLTHGKSYEGEIWTLQKEMVCKKFSYNPSGHQNFYWRIYLCFLRFNNPLQQSWYIVPFYSKLQAFSLQHFLNFLLVYLHTIAAAAILPGWPLHDSSPWDHLCRPHLVGHHQVRLLTPGHRKVPNSRGATEERLMISRCVGALYFLQYQHKFFMYLPCLCVVIFWVFIYRLYCFR